MLSEETRSIVKASIPALLQQGTTITKLFYKNMLEENEDLLNMFNRVNQGRGAQQTALATTVLAAAKNIDDLSVLLPHVKHIANKHRCLQVKPAHYAIVGKYLLIAISEVLGDAATPEIMNAWSEAYGAIADIFINAEKEMYAEESWTGWKPFEVTNRETVGYNIVEFTVKPRKESGIDLARVTVLAGQYITVKTHPMRQGNQYDALRHYSLSSVDTANGLKFAVKCLDSGDKPAGLVSEYLFKDVAIGDQLLLSAPAGDFNLVEPLIYQNEIPLVAVGSGIGVGPLVAMIENQAMKNPKRPIVWLQSNCGEADEVFKSHVDRILEGVSNPTQVIIKPDTQPRKIDETFRKHVTNNSDVYICGSTGFMQSMINYFRTLEVHNDCVHYEPFEPKMPSVKT
ncbi:hypothetical protein HG535_0C06410 [Zygotorulaspora mrakii]|uniref:nitric oxide dioxygenase n=1 Tax=Zygotorulaspora mrakii TaxID=42260 RepID=A0A7H9B1J3_ZYGMR|nr:uncharacterized protein HG535_0C06410 [Zygotorulaspora mrakii]QLG72286.1 hypothetical protein HG535_0C06410 [Zygotorulaspora mrakii]